MSLVVAARGIHCVHFIHAAVVLPAGTRAQVAVAPPLMLRPGIRRIKPAWTPEQGSQHAFELLLRRQDSYSHHRAVLHISGNMTAACTAAPGTHFVLRTRDRIWSRRSCNSVQSRAMTAQRFSAVANTQLVSVCVCEAFHTATQLAEQ